MTVWMVSRHPGAVEWARRQGIVFDRVVPHLDVREVAAGDTIYGTLPLPLAAEVSVRGAVYWHLCVALSASQRGQELAPSALEAADARFERFVVSREQGNGNCATQHR